MKKTLLAGFLISSFMASAADADSVLAKVRDRYDGQDYISDMTLTTKTKGGGSSEKSMYMLQKDIGDEEFLFISVQAPSDVRNVGFLVKVFKETKQIEDEQWMYLPAFRKVRRISAKDKRGAFMGSEFSYFDLDKLRVADFKSTIVGSETIDGRDTWKIERTPVNQDVINKAGYYKVVIYVDKERDIVLQQDYVDAKGIVFKKQQSLKVELVQDIWTIVESKMVNFTEEKESHIKYNKTVYNVGLSDGLFNIMSIKRGVDKSDVVQLTMNHSN
ncbi:Protein of unknown function (DUF1329) [Rheinheimera sp. A13L]|uniref:outer membrane lipoprotein-sorting protein n=1 Tax=Rheinheimera sp. A13L TaxID=506534 RepID=UPI00021254E9|nr:outer membrane lipoprotein-sorting protein [Rheinheimera sp. A13L]EGM77242.1 Protein of unknown function (DUF1329) [Rheinheimera sp. A13L]